MEAKPYSELKEGHVFKTLRGDERQSSGRAKVS